MSNLESDYAQLEFKGNDIPCMLNPQYPCWCRWRDYNRIDLNRRLRNQELKYAFHMSASDNPGIDDLSTLLFRLHHPVVYIHSDLFGSLFKATGHLVKLGIKIAKEREEFMRKVGEKDEYPKCTVFRIYKQQLRDGTIKKDEE